VTVYGPDLSNHNASVNFDQLDALSDVHLVTHKMSEGVGTTDRLVAGRAAQVKRFAAAGFYHVLWPTNSQDTPQNQAQWFVGRIAALAPWMFTHPCPVAQGDFELFSNFVPYRPPTIAECNSFNKWVLYYWRQHTQRPLYQPNYAPFWLYGNSLTGLAGDLWASSYVGGSGSYRTLYPGDGDRRWTQIPSKPARILQFSSLADFGAAAANVDGNGVRGVSTAAGLQQLLLGTEDTGMSQADIDAINAHTDQRLNLLFQALGGTDNSVFSGGTTAKDLRARIELLLDLLWQAIGGTDNSVYSGGVTPKDLQPAIQAVQDAVNSLRLTLSPDDIAAVAAAVVAALPPSSGGTAPTLDE